MRRTGGGVAAPEVVDFFAGLFGGAHSFPLQEERGHEIAVLAGGGAVEIGDGVAEPDFHVGCQNHPLMFCKAEFGEAGLLEMMEGGFEVGGGM